MGTLFIHIGHDKTGSSYLQAYLARNADALGARGILYPGRTRAMARAAAGGVSSGNGRFFEAPEALEAAARERAGRDVLLSYEGFFNALNARPGETLARFQSWRSALGLDEIRVLLFTRNPVGHAASAYQQMVKSGKVRHAPDRYFLNYRRPQQVWKVMGRVGAAPGVTLDLRNYDACRADLLGELSRWLGLADFDWAAPPVEQVNRSMTAAEIRLLLALNRVLPRASLIVANGFAEAMPGLASTRALPGRGVQKKMIDANADAIARVNARMPDPAQRYRVDYADPGDAGAGRGLSLRHYLVMAGCLSALPVRAAAAALGRA